MIKKAVITAAGKGTRQYPATNAVQKELFPLVDLHGITKPTIQLVVEEAMSAGINDIAVIVQPGEEAAFQNHFQPLTEDEALSFKSKPWGLEVSDDLRRQHAAITFLHEHDQAGFGHAVYCAKDWAAGEPVLLMLGDHVYVSNQPQTCAQQLQQAWQRYQTTIFGVMQTPAQLLYLFGTLAGDVLKDQPGAYRIDRIYEKPTPEYARQNLVTAGLAADHFLTIFGMYMLEPEIFNILDHHVKNDIRDRGEIQLTSALKELIDSRGAVGLTVNGERLDMGTPLGYLQTQLALGLRGPLADELRDFFQTR